MASGWSLDFNLLMLIVALCGVMAASGWWFRATNPPAGERDAIRRHREMARLERQMLESVTALVSQLEQTAVRINQTLDERARSVQALLRLADERIAQLALNETAEALTPIAPIADSSNLGSSEAHQTPPCESVSSPWDNTSAYSEAIDEGIDLILSHNNPPEPANPAPPPAQRVLETASADLTYVAAVDVPQLSINARREDEAAKAFGDARMKILRLHASGERPIDIAESLGLTLGEVELVLNIEQFTVAGS
ncbi:MAG: hypothetical protein JNG88_04235 [Phycisphaerales bacterium]|nr:hypothetical protein [Phycisphaerales bacterium]